MINSIARRYDKWIQLAIKLSVFVGHPWWRPGDGRGSGLGLAEAFEDCCLRERASAAGETRLDVSCDRHAANQGRAVPH